MNKEQDPNKSPEMDVKVELKKIGMKLTKLRKERGYTNSDQLAYENNINRSQYGKYEAGSQDIRLSSLIKILNIFGLTLEEFFKEENED